MEENQTLEEFFEEASPADAKEQAAAEQARLSRRKFLTGAVAGGAAGLAVAAGTSVAVWKVTDAELTAAQEAADAELEAAQDAADLELAETLADMGMPLAFSPSEADFSGMAAIPPRLRLYISRVLHKAYVAVDELGTEAAGATEIEMLVTGEPSVPEVIRVDRPFLFLIRDTEHDSILFLGRVVNPAS